MTSLMDGPSMDFTLYVSTRWGGGFSQKRTHADARGGGSVAKSGRPQIQIFAKIFEA